MRLSRRAHRFALPWILCFASPLCTAADPSPIAAVKTDINFEWSQVTRQQATVVIANSGTEAREVHVRLLSSGAEQDLVLVEPTKLNIPSHGDAMLSLGADPKKNGQKGLGAPFDAMLQIVDEKGAVLASTRISIAADIPVPAVTSLKRVAMKPLCGVWTLSLSVPLRNNFPPGYLAKENEVVGYLVSTAGRTLPVKFDRLVSNEGDVQAQYKVDAMESGAFTGNLYFDPQKVGTAFGLTVDSQDNVLFAILDIAAGIALAALVKNYLSNSRVLLLIKREALGIPRLIASATTTFQNQAPGSKYDPTVDLANQKAALNASLGEFSSWKRSMVDNRTWFNDRLQDIKALESQLNDWINLGHALEYMNGRIAAVSTACGGFAAGSEPLWIVDAKLTYEGGPILGTGIAKAIQDANNWYDFSRSWQAVFEYWTAWKLKATAVPRMKTDLFAAETANALAAVKTNIFSAIQASASAPPSGAGGGVFSLTAGAGTASAGFAPVVTSGVPSIEVRRARLRILLRSGDAASFLFSVSLAILGSLGTYYFGKPFGSWPDYLSLFVAAAGVKAGVDLIVSFADRFAGVAAARTV